MNDETIDEMQARSDKAIAEAGVLTEKQMRESEAPSPATSAELAAYVDTLTDRPHDYGTCVYAMSLAAVAAFNHVASKLGVTGFQASCADMDIIARTRRMKHGFMIVNANDLLYPQYDVPAKVADWVEKMRIELAPEAKRLSEAGSAHPDVMAHWKKLAEAAK